MRVQKDHFEPLPGGAGEFALGLALLKLLLVLAVEFGAFILHYAAYSQVMTLGPSGYLDSIPGIDGLFAAFPEAQVANLVAAALALASVATPVAAFHYCLSRGVLADPAGHFTYMPNRIYAGIIGVFWALMLSVEILSVMTLIDTYASNPFTRSEAARQLRDHAGLAFLAAAILSLVNAAIGLATAVVWHGLIARKGGAS
jgi:hypothetical protein